MSARLFWQKADGTEIEFLLEGAALMVGRDEEADVRVDEPLVSRLHARLEKRGDAWAVVDLGSTNLTRVNGVVVRDTLLKDGDELRFARAVCRFASPPVERPQLTAVPSPVREDG